MQTKEEYLRFVEDLQVISTWIGNNEELDAESRTLVITWLMKMANKLEENLNELIKLKEENEADNSTSEEN